MKYYKEVKESRAEVNQLLDELKTLSLLLHSLSLVASDLENRDNAVTG